MPNQTPHNTKHNQIVDSASSEVGKGGKPSQSINSLKIFNDINNKTYAFMRRNEIMYPQMQVLLIISTHWERHNKGISAYGIMKQLDIGGSRSSIITGLMRKLVDLLQSRHIDIVGTSARNARLYAPSIKTLNALISIVQSA